MPRSLKTILACGFLVLFLAIGFGAGPVQATTYNFYATVVPGDLPSTMNFSLQYIDTGNNLFALGELVPGSFSGVKNSVSPSTYTGLLGVPTHGSTYLGQPAGPLTDGPPYFVESPAAWTFYEPTNAITWRVWGTRYTYDQVPVADPIPPSVPLPPTVLLLGSSLLGLAGWRRLRKS